MRRGLIGTTTLAGLLLVVVALLSMAASAPGRAAARKHHGRGRSGAFYPAALPSRGGALGACPSPSGLRRPDALVEAQARVAAILYGRVSLATDIANSDRAWRPQVRAMWSYDSGKPLAAETRVVRSETPAGASGYRIIVRRSCGAPLIRRSIVVTVAPATPVGQSPCEACAEHVFFLDRRGRALIYFVY